MLNSESDLESDYDLENDYDEEEYTINVYEPEEPCNTRFVIALCELYNENLHGKEETDVKYHYLVNQRYKNLYMDLINDTIEFINMEYQYLLSYNHAIFRNYRNIVLNNYIKPQIVECFYLSSNHCIAIVKTFWIKLIQRTYKSILKKREEIDKRKTKLISIRYREINGKWPQECLEYVPLKGMLSYLK